MTIHSIEAFFWNSVQQSSHFLGDKAQLFRSMTTCTILHPKGNCLVLRIPVADALNPISDSSTCLYFPKVKLCTHQRKNFVSGIQNHFLESYNSAEKSQSSWLFPHCWYVDPFIACTGRPLTLLSEISLLLCREFLFQGLYFSSTNYGAQNTTFAILSLFSSLICRRLFQPKWKWLPPVRYSLYYLPLQELDGIKFL